MRELYGAVARQQPLLSGGAMTEKGLEKNTGLTMGLMNEKSKGEASKDKSISSVRCNHSP